MLQRKQEPGTMAKENLVYYEAELFIFIKDHPVV